MRPESHQMTTRRRAMDDTLWSVRLATGARVVCLEESLPPSLLCFSNGLDSVWSQCSPMGRLPELPRQC